MGETYRTESGKELTDADIEQLSAEAERGFDTSKLVAQMYVYLIGTDGERISAIQGASWGVRAKQGRVVLVLAPTRWFMAKEEQIAGFRIDDAEQNEVHRVMYESPITVTGWFEQDEVEFILSRLPAVTVTVEVEQT